MGLFPLVLILIFFVVSVYKCNRLKYIYIVSCNPLVNSQICSSSFLMVSLGLSMYSIMSSAVTILLLLFFPVCTYLFIFLVLLSWLRLPKLFAKSGESRHPCLAPNLEERLLFTIENDACCRLVICGLY